MFLKKPFMSERSEFKRVFKKHTNVAGVALKFTATRQHGNDIGFEILLNSLRSDIKGVQNQNHYHAVVELGLSSV